MSMGPSRTCARLIADCRGAAVLEFAFIGPVLFTLLLGTVDVGRMFYVRQNLEYATEEAARYYMLNPSASESDVTAQFRAKLSAVPSASVTPTYTHTTSCNGNASVICSTITARYDFSFLAGYLGLGTKPLQAKAQAVRITG
jgi:Flp pilus assembly protein TadG